MLLKLKLMIIWSKMPSKKSKFISNFEPIQELILELRSNKVMIDSDLAKLYGVSTKALNQAVKRNLNRFPQDFMFKLTKEEKTELVTNCDQFKQLKYSSSLPNAFTEHGVLMLASVLNSEIAINTSIEIVKAFVKMREMLASNQELAKKINSIERKVLQHDTKFKAVFDAIRKLILLDSKDAKPVGFHVNMGK